MQKHHRLVILLLILATAVTLGSSIAIINQSSKSVALDSTNQVALSAYSSSSTVLTNLAIGKPLLTLSSTCSINSTNPANSCCLAKPAYQTNGICNGFNNQNPVPTFATDNNPATFYCSDKRSSVTGYNDYVAVDLGTTTPISRVTLDLPKTSPYACGAPTDFQIQVSNDNLAWTTVATKTGQSTTTAHTIDFPETSARYARLYTTKVVDNSGWRLGVKEIGVWGKASPKADLIIQDVVRAPNGGFVVSIKNIGNVSVNAPSSFREGVCYDVLGVDGQNRNLYNGGCLKLSSYPLAPGKVATSSMPVPGYSGMVYFGMNGLHPNLDNPTSGQFVTIEAAKVVAESRYDNNSFSKNFGTAPAIQPTTKANVVPANTTLEQYLNQLLTTQKGNTGYAAKVATSSDGTKLNVSLESANKSEKIFCGYYTHNDLSCGSSATLYLDGRTPTSHLIVFDNATMDFHLAPGVGQTLCQIYNRPLYRRALVNFTGRPIIIGAGVGGFSDFFYEANIPIGATYVTGQCAECVIGSDVYWRNGNSIQVTSTNNRVYNVATFDVTDIDYFPSTDFKLEPHSDDPPITDN